MQNLIKLCKLGVPCLGRGRVFAHMAVGWCRRAGGHNAPQVVGSCLGRYVGASPRERVAPHAVRELTPQSGQSRGRELEPWGLPPDISCVILGEVLNLATLLSVLL